MIFRKKLAILSLSVGGLIIPQINYTTVNKVDQNNNVNNINNWIKQAEKGDQKDEKYLFEKLSKLSQSPENKKALWANYLLRKKINTIQEAKVENQHQTRSLSINQMCKINENKIMLDENTPLRKSGITTNPRIHDSTFGTDKTNIFWDNCTIAKMNLKYLLNKHPNLVNQIQEEMIKNSSAKYNNNSLKLDAIASGASVPFAVIGYIVGKALTEVSPFLKGVLTATVSGGVAMAIFDLVSGDKSTLENSLFTGGFALGTLALSFIPYGIPLAFLLNALKFALDNIKTPNGHTATENIGDHGLNDWEFQLDKHLDNLIETSFNFSQHLSRGVKWQVTDSWFAFPKIRIKTQKDPILDGPNVINDYSKWFDGFTWGKEIEIGHSGYQKLELLNAVLANNAIWSNYINGTSEEFNKYRNMVSTASIKSNWKNNTSSYDAQICTIDSEYGIQVFINRPKVTNYIDMSFGELQEKFYIPSNPKLEGAYYAPIKDEFLNDIVKVCNFSDNGKGWNTVDIDREGKWPVHLYKEGHNLVVQHNANFNEDEDHHGYMLGFVISKKINNSNFNFNHRAELSIKSEYVENDFWNDDEEWHRDTYHINTYTGGLKPDSENSYGNWTSTYTSNLDD